MIKVLIAEDNAVNRELLRELLESRGYAVSDATAKRRSGLSSRCRLTYCCLI